ncbi:stalk domain-containing protein [Paenibacillus terreus]|uniref:Stalk domain-containing protein n=2 Tax=Paenibacillus terreus TaxID=1387834 RepID=A0ABV5BET9_9BACL
MWRKLLIASCSAFLLIAGSSVHAESVDSVILGYPNGEEQTLRSEEYIFLKGSIMVSPYKVTGVLPFSVPGKGIWWLHDEQTVIFAFTDPDDFIKARLSIKAGEKELIDDGKSYTLRQEAVLQDGRVYLPIREIAEAYGHDVQYTKSDGKINISIEQ